MYRTNPEFYWLAFALVTTVSSSRLIRLWTYDDFPPVAWVNAKFMDFTEKRLPSWTALGFCPWCVGFWITLIVVGWADAAGVLDGKPAWGGTGDLSQPLWWIINGALASSYLAAMLMARDGDSSNDKPDKTESAV